MKGMRGMDLRGRIAESLKSAMKEKAADRLSTLRLINAAIKDRDIARRADGGDGSDEGVGDSEILQILGKMVKQRQDSAQAYEEGGRLELAEKEREEITVIEEFLPKQMNDDETEAAVAAAIESTGAESIRDMGKVMAALKAKYTGRMDFGKAGTKVKGKLA